MSTSIYVLATILSYRLLRTRMEGEKHNEMRWYYNTVYHLSLQTVYMVGMDRDEEYYMACYERQEYCVDGRSFFTRYVVSLPGYVYMHWIQNMYHISWYTMS